MEQSKTPIRLPKGLYYGWVIVAVAFIAQMAAAPLNPVVFSFFVLPMSEELGWTRSDIAWSIAIRMITGGISAPFFGPMVDRYGTRWLGTIAGMLAGLTTIALFLVNDLWVLYALSVASGLSGFGAPTGSLLTGVPVAKWFDVKRGRAMAFTIVGLAVGVVTAIPLSGYLIGAIGWRFTWVIFGIFMSATIVPAYALLMRRDPEDYGLVPDGVVSRSGIEATRNISPSHDKTLRDSLSTGVLWVILMAQILQHFTSSGTIVHRTAFFQDVGLPAAMVTVGIALDPFLVIFTVILFGILAEKMEIRYLGVLGAVLRSISILPMLFFIRNHFYLIFVHSAVWAISAGATISFQNLVWPVYFGRRYLGSIRGVLEPITVAAGALGAPVIGYVIDQFGGFTNAWSITTVVILISVAMYFFARPPTVTKSE